MKEEYSNLVLDRVAKKLATWKGVLLSRVSKYQLLKLVLQSILVCFLLVFKIPSAVSRNIEQIQKTFL